MAGRAPVIQRKVEAGMNSVARETLGAFRECDVPGLPFYDQALIEACTAFPPPFGEQRYGDVYRSRAADPEWIAFSLIAAAKSEGDGSQHLLAMAACTPDEEIARQMRQHALDEAHHSRLYVTSLRLIFPTATDGELQAQLRNLSPNYSGPAVCLSSADSPWAYPATVDELIQMNLAEIRTRAFQLIQRPVLLSACPQKRRQQVGRILDKLLLDETRHVLYTALLIERHAQASATGGAQVAELMRERLHEFNQMTEADLAAGSFATS
jgi:hypothetical protein